MKCLFLSSLLCCILVAEISAGYKEIIGGALFSTVCAGLGYATAKRALPARYTSKAPLVGVVSGVVSGLACLVAARSHRPVTHERAKRYNTFTDFIGYNAFTDFIKGHIAGGVVLAAAAVAQAAWNYAPECEEIEKAVTLL